LPAVATAARAASTSSIAASELAFA